MDQGHELCGLNGTYFEPACMAVRERVSKHGVSVQFLSRVRRARGTMQKDGDACADPSSSCLNQETYMQRHDIA